MNNTNKWLGGTALAITLALGLVTPSLADKLSNSTAPAAATSTPATPAIAVGDIDFGDDTSEWAKDGECDDPRFTGTGVAVELVDADLMKDATDCRAAVEAGTATLKAGADAPLIATVAPPAITAADIDFGDDTSEWAKDGECDDPRFTGTGVAVELVDADLGKDATDCRTAYEAGTITLVDEGDIVAATTEIDYGDDSGDWANDGECDDPRFTGAGVAAELLDADLKKDATDCRAAVEAGTATLKTGTDTAITLADIDFGDDSSDWANDGECDDPRFTGTGVANTLLEEDLKADATDCRAAVEAGTATLKGDGDTVAATEFDYGSDFSRWANDGQCDDKRFMGEGTDKKLLPEDMFGDATDCKALEAEGKVSIRPVYDPAYAAAAPYDSSAIDFGDNKSDYADDDQCDDPRFEGPGAATTLLDSDLRHDRNDCKALFEAGKIVLLP